MERVRRSTRARRCCVSAGHTPMWRRCGSPIRSSRPPMSGKPSAARSGTIGAKSTLPANHGLTVCRSDDSTSITCPVSRARTCAAVISPANSSVRAWRPPHENPAKTASAQHAASVVRRVHPAHHEHRRSGRGRRRRRQGRTDLCRQVRRRAMAGEFLLQAARVVPRARAQASAQAGQFSRCAATAASFTTSSSSSRWALSRLRISGQFMVCPPDGLFA